MISGSEVKIGAEPNGLQVGRRQPRLSEQRMYSILLAGDPDYNGRFFTGVLTTGVGLPAFLQGAEAETGECAVFCQHGGGADGGAAALQEMSSGRFRAGL